MAEAEAATRSGFVALLGAPNAGKSTLLNRMVGAKVSIVTPKAQTTRARITGIAMEGAAQIVFVDTPGIFAPKRRLDRAMVAAAWQGAKDADLVVLLVDAARRNIDRDTAAIIEGLKESGHRTVLALNKVDLVRRDTLLAKAQALNERLPFTATFMISAATGDGVDDLKRWLAEAMPPGPFLFDPEQISDLPVRLLAAEITREKLFLNLHDELPYALTVENEAWEEFKDGSVKISQTIYVERESQRAIALGKGGQRIRKVRELAAAEIAEMLERPVHLFLFVKVRADWGEDPQRYTPWGLDPKA
ncbi:MAG: GTPase Era [Thalassobaculales bacterium]